MDLRPTVFHIKEQDDFFHIEEQRVFSRRKYSNCSPNPKIHIPGLASSFAEKLQTAIDLLQPLSQLTMAKDLSPHIFT